MSVQRYWVGSDCTTLVENGLPCDYEMNTHDTYVLASDYDALAQRCERLEKALAFYDSRGRCDYAGPCEYRAALASHDSKESKK